VKAHVWILFVVWFWLGASVAMFLVWNAGWGPPPKPAQSASGFQPKTTICPICGKTAVLESMSDSTDTYFDGLHEIQIWNEQSHESHRGTVYSARKRFGL
jgi:hypothetical protein